MPTYRVTWVERYEAILQADSPEEASANAECSVSNYLGVEEEGVEEIKDAVIHS